MTDPRDTATPPSAPGEDLLQEWAAEVGQPRHPSLALPRIMVGEEVADWYRGQRNTLAAQVLELRAILTARPVAAPIAENGAEA